MRYAIHSARRIRHHTPDRRGPAGLRCLAGRQPRSAHPADGGRRTDHDRPNHFWELLEFASEDDAAQVAELPETKAAYQRWSSLVDGEPAFHNLDVVEQVGGAEGSPSVGVAAWRTPGGG